MASKRNDRDQLLERPLSPRSVIASLLLGRHPPRLPGSRLVRWCGIFGIAEGTARVTLTRMVDRGELAAVDGVYELRGAVRKRQAAQDWSRRPHLLEWSRTWRTAIVRGSPRQATDRAALRDAMRRLRYAELRESVWTRPDNLPRASGLPAAWETVDTQCDWWSTVPDRDAKQLAGELFATHAWKTRARALHAELTRSTRSLRRPADAQLARAFEVGAATLLHVRADALLPAELLPSGWPGRRLRDAYDEYEAAFGIAVEEWFRTKA